MNANEVIATLAGDDVHANDDVNMGQSSNDVFPSAVHLAALDELTNDLMPALQKLADSLQAKAAEFDDVVKSGRTHWMDAVPVTLGQEFAGYAAQVRQGFDRVGSTLDRLGQIPLGGTAVGTGLNTHPEFAARVRTRLSADTGLTISAPADPFEAQAARDGLVEASGALKTVAVSLTKIANDLRFLGSGPRAGLAEIALPELQKGSSIMPGKVNPVIPEVVTQVAAQVIGNDQAITIGGMNGHFELNVYVPVMARNLLQSIKLLASASRLLAEKCVDGIVANRETCEHYAELTLSAAAALNPYIGYDKGSEIVKDAASSGRSLREVAREAGVEDAVLDQALDYRAMAKPTRASRSRPSSATPIVRHGAVPPHRRRGSRRRLARRVPRPQPARLAAQPGRPRAGRAGPVGRLPRPHLGLQEPGGRGLGATDDDLPPRLGARPAGPEAAPGRVPAQPLVDPQGTRDRALRRLLAHPLPQALRGHLRRRRLPGPHLHHLRREHRLGRRGGRDRRASSSPAGSTRRTTGRTSSAATGRSRVSRFCLSLGSWARRTSRSGSASSACAASEKGMRA